MVAWKWPGVNDLEYFDDKTRRSVDDDGGFHHTWYAMKMEASKCNIKRYIRQVLTNIQYIRQFFSDDFWNSRYLRFGSGAFSDFAAVGIRYTDSDNTPMPKRIKTIGLEFEADEWMPDVKDPGIVYRDKVIDFSSGKEIAKKVKTAEEVYMDELAKAFVVKDLKKLKTGIKDRMGSPGKSSLKKKSKKKTGKKY
ncbi:unnamed protein product [Aureobasidium uvarum]|uniref:Uncharacterized protein n=1 Tax=Aureobasidium uvarum TaxID=2773716 RepID=A0A9N8KAU2_9PEZI|nr:unnamed protein product [Aureobasidium uvarum]